LEVFGDIMSDLYTEQYMHAAAQFKEAAKAQDETFQAFRKSVFTEGPFDKKMMELMALSAAVSLHCEYCVDTHSKKAKAYGASKEEVARAIEIGAFICAAAAQSYSMRAFQE